MKERETEGKKERRAKRYEGKCEKIKQANVQSSGYSRYDGKARKEGEKERESSAGGRARIEREADRCVGWWIRREERKEKDE